MLPQGFFAGTYDPWDIVAYAIGLCICYGCEKWQASRSKQSDSES